MTKVKSESLIKFILIIQTSGDTDEIEPALGCLNPKLHESPDKKWRSEWRMRPSKIMNISDFES
jgi:hypothetical protein